MPSEILAETAQPVETVPGLVKTAVPASPHETAAERVKELKSPSADELAHFGRDACAALAQSHAALARGLEVLSEEMAGLALSGIDRATRTATKMLSVKTLSDAIEVNAGFTCGSLDALIGSSAKLSELGVKLAVEASEPILTQFGKGWIKGRGLGS
jgi:hypothetical protein